MKELISWLAVLAAFVLGLGLVLQPNLISSLPSMIHYLLGGILIALSAYAAYMLAK